jgi:hypothetical protein
MAESTLYLRNRRPNRVVLNYAGSRFVLERRGSREDSVSLPADAAKDTTISRWLKQGILEKISKDSFMRLGARTVDTPTAQFIKRPVRDQRRRDLTLHPADGDTTRSLSQIKDSEVSKSATPNLEWAGDLMTTEEELDEFPEESEKMANYPSKHRDDEEARRKQMGY